MAAMLRTVKASPGSRPRVTDGHTRESAQANTMYCMQQRKKITIRSGKEGARKIESGSKCNILLSSQIVSHSKNLGESNFFKFD